MLNLYELLMAKIRRVNEGMYKRILEDYPSGSGNIRDLNNYFRLVLSQVPVGTINERECLVDDLSNEAWLDYFMDTVYPTLDKYNLPQC